MILDEIVKIIEGEILTDFRYDNIEIEIGFAADLMSDVLVFARPNTLMLTGLVNPQAIRTAEMSDIPAILFVRGKRPPQHLLEQAEMAGIPLLLSPYTMYETCGRLYKAGLAGMGKVPIVDQR